jgi:mannose-6-phosphate isomerase-like protein (cupin superfamily)
MALSQRLKHEDQRQPGNTRSSEGWPAPTPYPQFTSMNKINLDQKLSLFSAYWQPHIAGELNGQYVKLVKFKGPFTWHYHELEDELFLVLKGRFRMEYRAQENGEAIADRSVWLEEGEMIIVPHGVEHRPVADEECQVMLFEPASTLNTGNIEDEFTVKELQQI